MYHSFIPPPFLTRLGRILLGLLWGVGLASGIFLLLCAVHVIDPSVWQTADTVEPVLVPVEDVPAHPPAFQGVFLPLDALDQAPSSGEIMVSMKAGDGSLGYVSALTLAADCGASSADPQRNDALRLMNQTKGLYTTALVSCLRDESLTAHDPALALHRTSGSPWRDAQHMGWLDPACKEVQHYLIGICRELAWLGFDEIVLTDCAFPPAAPDALREKESRSEVLTSFCQQIQEEMAAFPVQLSIQGIGDAKTDPSLSGQTPSLLAAFYRVWATEETAPALSAFMPSVIPAFP